MNKASFESLTQADYSGKGMHRVIHNKVTREVGAITHVSTAAYVRELIDAHDCLQLELTMLLTQSDQGLSTTWRCQRRGQLNKAIERSDLLAVQIVAQRRTQLPHQLCSAFGLSWVSCWLGDLAAGLRRICRIKTSLLLDSFVPLAARAHTHQP